MFKNKRTKTVFLIVDIVLLILLAVAVVHAQLEKSDAPDVQDDVDSIYARYIDYNGEEYPVKHGLQSILLIGKDAMEGRREKSDIEAFYNDDLADFLLVLVFDHENKTVTPLQINRDTVCDVPWLSVNGMVGGYEPMQITMAHTFGSGKRDSTVNTANAVSGLLYGAPIDRFFTFSMDTVPILNDLVGGVTVTLEDDIPTLGPEYVKGAVITLKGEEALRFVRTRDTEALDANLARMGHHRLYMDAFLKQARVKYENNPGFVADAYEKIEPFLVTDLTVENMSEMVKNFYEYELLPVLTPTGSYTLSERETAEFHADEDSLWSCVRSAFCP